MLKEKKVYPIEKTQLHSRNKHRERYNFKQLIESCPDLATFVIINKFGDDSIDFFDNAAVKMLNKALLKHFYKIENWDIPSNYLTPPIPGRADYIHHIAEFLGESNNGKIPFGKQIMCLDIGVGANCIYPIIANYEYGWSFIGSDIDTVSIESAKKIVDSNISLKTNIEFRLQSSPKDIFKGIIKDDEFIDLTICNPPFHSSLKDAQSATLRKLKNLKQKKITIPEMNFGGKNNEIWCIGGELRFVKAMIKESKQFANSCFWFSTLISKESNLRGIYAELKKVNAVVVRTIPMAQGNKTSRIVAWTYLSMEQQKKWVKIKWK